MSILDCFFFTAFHDSVRLELVSLLNTKVTLLCFLFCTSLKYLPGSKERRGAADHFQHIEYQKLLQSLTAPYATKKNDSDVLDFKDKSRQFRTPPPLIFGETVLQHCQRPKIFSTHSTVLVQSRSKST